MVQGCLAARAGDKTPELSKGLDEFRTLVAGDPP